MFAPVVRRAQEAGLWVRAYVSMCFGDPWEGPVPVDQVADACAELMDLGCDQLSVGDTIGTGTTGHVEALLAAWIGVTDAVGATRRLLFHPLAVEGGRVIGEVDAMPQTYSLHRITGVVIDG